MAHDLTTRQPSAAAGSGCVNATALRRAAAHAARAPSIHNTQPWRFVLRPGALELKVDRTRRLGVLDPRGRQMMISCGCALLNARVALAGMGLRAGVGYFPDPADDDLVARVTVVGGTRTTDALGELDESVARRRTNRREFGGDPLPDQLLQQLVTAARAERATLLPISGEHRAIVAGLATRAMLVEQADPAYLDELLVWTTDDLRRPDGVQAASVPYTGAGRAPDVPVPMRDFDPRGMGWLPPSSRAGTADTLLLVATTGDTSLDWLRAGEAVERVWLMLTHLGYAAGPLSQLIEVAETYHALRARLRLDGHPQLLLRVGRAAETRESNRRPLADVLVEEHTT